MRVPSQLLVIVPTAGRSQLLRRTLESLARCRCPDGYCGTLVIENGPKGNAEEITQAFKDSLGAQYKYVERAGKSHALNVAIETLADDCLIYMTDDDVRFNEGALEHISDAADGYGSGVFFGGATDVDFETPPTDWLVRHLPAHVLPFGESEFEKGSRYLVFLGYNWAAFAGDLRRAGGFDTRFGPGGSSGAIGQESVMQQRLLKIGVRPEFVPGALVWHYIPSVRCSPEWFIHRQYRYAILDQMHCSKPNSRLGIPWWHLRRLGRDWLRYLKSRLSSDEETKFLAKRRYYERWGRVVGAWRACRTNPATENESEVREL